jgi:hypothetical protein
LTIELFNALRVFTQLGHEENLSQFIYSLVAQFIYAQLDEWWNASSVSKWSFPLRAKTTRGRQSIMGKNTFHSLLVLFLFHSGFFSLHLLIPPPSSLAQLVLLFKQKCHEF